VITAFHHPGFAAPIGDHVMPMRKFQLVADGLAGRAGVRVAAPAPIELEALRRVHTDAYIDAVKSGEPRALAESQKFPWSPALWPSVLLTNGGALAAATRALDDGIAAALASGFHHSHADHGEGFCTFNGLVVAAEAGVRPGLGAEQRRADGLVLAARKFRVRLRADLDDARPVFDLFEVGAAGDLMGEVVPGTGREAMCPNDIGAYAQEFFGATRVLLE
jgi:hypothetical protein